MARDGDNHEAVPEDAEHTHEDAKSASGVT
jgi:hypothetical protein